MMAWLLGISVVFNILILAAVAALVYGVVTAQNEAFHNHERWQEWEQRWYEAQALVSEELGYHISPSGLRSKTTLSKRDANR